MNQTQSNPVDEFQPATGDSSNSTRLTGAAAMRAAVEAQLLLQSDAIAKALVESCIEGHMMAGRLLYLIAVDKVKMDPEEVKESRCIADKWQGEPEWTPEAAEELSDDPDSSFDRE